MDKHGLENEFLRIEYLTDSLRIISLIPADRPNLLADLSDLPPVPTPYGDYYFRGGHRLWHSPEVMPRTYIPDDELTITEQANNVILESSTGAGTGIRKRIAIQLSEDRPCVTIMHTLLNDGLWPVELAPWAITQLRLGGTAILPMPVGNADSAGLLPNRQLSLWPYTRINDPRLKLNDDFILFKAEALLPAFKIGYFNPHGWMAYWLEGVLFRKTFSAQVGATYPDHNSNAELYCNHQFIELESLAPLITLLPGASVSHMETWEIVEGLTSLPSSVQTSLMSH